MVFWNEKADIGKHAFFIPTGRAVASGDYKLIFVVHDGEHYLKAIWNSAGTEVITSQFQIPLATGDTVTEVKLLDR